MKNIIFSAIVLIFTFSICFSIQTVELNGKDIAISETNLGNFVTDAIKESANTDVAIVHAKLFVNNPIIKEGEVTEKDFRNIFVVADNPIVILTLPSNIIFSMMERSLSMLPNSNVAFLQISNAKVKYDSTKPSGKRILSITINGQEIKADDDKKFEVAMPKDLASGGAGYIRIFPPEIVDNMVDTKKTLIQMVMGKANKDQNITAKVEGRIVSE